MIGLIGKWLKKRDEKAPRFLRAFQPAAQAVEDTSVSPMARIVGLTICAIFSFFLIWAFVGHLDIVASARGRLVPVGQVKVIQPLEQSTVRAIKVKEGDFVKKGDILIELDLTNPDADFERISYELQSAKLRVEMISQLLSQDSLSYLPYGFGQEYFKQGRYPQDIIETQVNILTAMVKEHRAGVAGLVEEINAQKSAVEAMKSNLQRLDETLPLVKERFERVKELADKELMSKIAALQVEQEYIEARESLSSGKETLLSEESRLRSLEQEKNRTAASFRRRLHEDLSKSKSTVADLSRQQDKVTRLVDLGTLRAPIDGYVQQLRVSTINGIVGPGETLMIVVPYNVDVEAEVFIANKDIGFVEQDQDVEIKLDTFKFTKYGLVKGKVKALTRNTVLTDQLATMPSENPIDQQGFYAARIVLEKQEMLVDGRSVPLTAGMSVTAEIKTGQRRVLDYLLSPLMQYADEAMQER